MASPIIVNQVIRFSRVFERGGAHAGSFDEISANLELDKFSATDEPLVFVGFVEIDKAEDKDWVFERTVHGWKLVNKREDNAATKDDLKAWVSGSVSKLSPEESQAIRLVKCVATLPARKVLYGGDFDTRRYKIHLGIVHSDGSHERIAEKEGDGIFSL